MVHCNIFFSCNSNLLHQPPKSTGFQSVRIHPCCTLLWPASADLTCNQRPACLCQSSTLNCLLMKDWKVCVLRPVPGGFSQPDSSSVFPSPWDIMDSSRQWNTIPAGSPAWQPPERLSHITPSPCKSQTQPSLEICMGQMEGWGEDGRDENQGTI